jgi:hypothetical protein
MYCAYLKVHIDNLYYQSQSQYGDRKKLIETPRYTRAKRVSNRKTSRKRPITIFVVCNPVVCNPWNTKYLNWTCYYFNLDQTTPQKEKFQNVHWNNQQSNKLWKGLSVVSRIGVKCNHIISLRQTGKECALYRLIWLIPIQTVRRRKLLILYVSDLNVHLFVIFLLWLSLMEFSWDYTGNIWQQYWKTLRDENTLFVPWFSFYDRFWRYIDNYTKFRCMSKNE